MSNDYVDCGDTYEEDCNDSCWDASGDEYCIEQEKEMDSIISRLKNQKEKAEDSYLKRGNDDGHELAKIASYLDLVAVNNGYFQNDDVNRFSEKEEIWEEFVQEVWAQDARLGRGEDNLLNPLTQAWVRGFFSGIKDFWAEVVQAKVEA